MNRWASGLGWKGKAGKAGWQGSHGWLAVRNERMQQTLGGAGGSRASRRVPCFPVAGSQASWDELQDPAEAGSDSWR